MKKMLLCVVCLLMAGCYPPQVIEQNTTERVIIHDRDHHGHHGPRVVPVVPVIPVVPVKPAPPPHRPQGNLRIDVNVR